MYPGNYRLDELKHIALDSGNTDCLFTFAETHISSMGDISKIFNQLKDNGGNVELEVEASNLLAIFGFAYTGYDEFDSDVDGALVNMASRFPRIFENYETGSFHFEETARNYGMYKFEKFLKGHRSYAPFSVKRDNPIKRGSTWTSYSQSLGAKR